MIKRGAAMAPKKLDKIKSSVFSRGFAMAKLSVSAGAQMAGQSIGNLVRDPEQRKLVWKEFLSQQTSLFAQEVSQLKGSLLKAGQLLSIYGEHFFPPEINEVLRSLQSESAPLKWSVIEEILKERLGEKYSELDVEEDSYAAASLGQVHLATIKATGRRLALKIQYPNVDVSIDSDLKMLKWFLNASRILPADLNLEPIFDEIRDVLKQEANYLREADLMDEYNQRLGPDPRFVIPKVHRQYSSEKLLATQFEPSVRVDSRVVAGISQERRNNLSLALLDLFFKEIYQWHLVQTDAHTANFGIRLNSSGQDQVVLYDFGATRKYPSEFMQNYTGLINAAFKNEHEEFVSLSLKLQFLLDSDPSELKEKFEDIFMMSVEPFANTDYDWGNSELPSRSMNRTMELIKGYPLRPPPRELIFINRKTAGVFTLLSLLKAKLNTHNLMNSYVSQQRA